MNSSGKDPRDKVTSLLPMLPICPRLSLKCCLCKVCGAANHPTLGTASNRQVAPNVETECYPVFLLRGVSGILTLAALPAAQLLSPSGVHKCLLTNLQFIQAFNHYTVFRNFWTE